MLRLAAAVAFGAAGGLLACGPARPPNVLLVVVDTLRADHSSVYGYDRDTTPRLAAFGAEGAVFEQAYSPVGLTAPAHASLFTALHPLTHGLVRNGLVLGDEHVTLAEYLAVRGYQTAGIASSFVLHHRFGLAQGFAYWDDSFEPAEATVSVAEWEGFAVEEGFDRRADHTARRAVQWLHERRSPEAPFFLFVHFFDPHAPYEPPSSHAGRFPPASDDARARDVSAYDAEIAFTDDAIGELLDALDELHLARDTLALITADHGEGLMQRGYMLHGLSVHEEELRVPLLVRWPGHIAAGRRIREPVSLLDLAPTIADLVALRRMGAAFEGRSLAAALRDGEAPDPQRPIYLYRRDFGPQLRQPSVVGDTEALAARESVAVAGWQYAVRQGRFKYVLAPAESAPVLYDLEADPEELVDAAAANPGPASRLRARLERWIGSHPAPPAAAQVPSARDRVRLEALGYAE